MREKSFLCLPLKNNNFINPYLINEKYALVYCAWKALNMELHDYSYILGAVILILAVIKTVHFIKNKNRNWKFHHWFYFNQKNIKVSTNSERVKLKKVQNAYSIFIYILLFITIIYSLVIFLGY